MTIQTQISADHKPTLVEQSNTLLQIYSNEALQLKMMPIWEQEKAQVRFSLMEKESQKLGRPLRASSTERVRKQADVQFNEYLHGVSESARRDGVATGTLLGAGITGVFVAPIATAVGYGVGEVAEYGAKKLGASEGVAGAAGLFAGVLGGTKASTYTLSLAQKRMLGALIKNSQSIIGKTATQKLSSLVHSAKMSVKPGIGSVEVEAGMPMLKKFTSENERLVQGFERHPHGRSLPGEYAASSHHEIRTFANRQETREAAYEVLGRDSALGKKSKDFLKDASGKNRDFKMTDLGDGRVKIEYFSPANNPGFGKQYVRIFDKNRGTFFDKKYTVGPDGVVEIKIPQSKWETFQKGEK